MAGSSKLHFVCPNEIVEWTVFSMSFLSFFAVFRLWEEHSATLAQKRKRSCQKCILLEQQNFSRKVCFLKKIFTFRIFPSFDEKLCELLSEGVLPDLKNCSLQSFRGSSGIILSYSSRKFTPADGFWGKSFGVL